MVLVMSGETILSLAAIMALLPAALSARRTRYERDAVFWALLAAATAGPMLVLVARTADGWRGDFATAMWLTVTATMLIFAAVAILTDLGINTVKLLTNNPTKVTEMEAAGEPFFLALFCACACVFSWRVLCWRAKRAVEGGGGVKMRI